MFSRNMKFETSNMQKIHNIIYWWENVEMERNIITYIIYVKKSLQLSYLALRNPLIYFR